MFFLLFVKNMVYFLKINKLNPKAKHRCEFILKTNK